jgi:hypothetical protein
MNSEWAEGSAKRLPAAERRERIECPFRPAVESGNIDRAAKSSAEIVLTQGWLRSIVVIVEPIVRVEYVVTKIVECNTVKFIRAGSGEEGELAAGGPAIFR